MSSGHAEVSRLGQVDVRRREDVIQGRGGIDVLEVHELDVVLQRAHLHVHVLDGDCAVHFAKWRCYSLPRCIAIFPFRLQVS